MNQEAVVDLHPEELHLSGEEEEESQGMDNGRADHDLGLKIRRTVTQVRGGARVLGDSRVPLLYSTRCAFTMRFTSWTLSPTCLTARTA